MSKRINFIVKNLVAFGRVLIIVFVLILVYKWLNDNFQVNQLFRNISAEGYFGLGLTIVTTFVSSIYERVRRRDEFILEGQKRNQLLINENHRIILETIQELEIHIDEIRIGLNAFESLISKDEKHDADIQAIRAEFSTLQVDFADLNQRQMQGDRLAHFADIIADCIKSQEQINARFADIEKNRQG